VVGVEATVTEEAFGNLVDEAGNAEEAAEVAAEVAAVGIVVDSWKDSFEELPLALSEWLL